MSFAQSLLLQRKEQAQIITRTWLIKSARGTEGMKDRKVQLSAHDAVVTICPGLVGSRVQGATNVSRLGRWSQRVRVAL